MTETWEQKILRFEAAKEFIGTLADSIYNANKDVEFGLRVFGHRHSVEEKNCYDSRLEVPFSKMNNEQVKRRLRFINPYGVSPIAWSLKQSAEYDFELDAQYLYSLILITDGGESCNGDICATMTNIVNKKISFTPYIISLVDYEPLRKEYECMGEYLVVKDKPTMASTISFLLDKNKNFIGDENTKYIPKTVVVETPKITVPDPPKVIIPTSPKPIEPVVTVSKNPTKIDKIQIAKVQYLLPYKLSWNNKKVTIPRLPKITAPIEPAIVQTPRVETPKPVVLNKTDVKKIESLSSYVKFKTSVYKLPNKVAIKPLPLIKVPEEPVEITKVNIERIPLNITGRRMNYMFSIATAKPLKIPALPRLTIYASDLVSSELKTNNTLPTSTPNITTSNPSVTNQPKQNPLEPGTFQLYFTNGQGKYYSTEPPLEVIDIKTNKQVWKGERRLGADKQPKPITIPDGSYVVQVIGSSRKANVTIEKGINKKVEIVVTKGSLSFGYKNTNEKPKGFIARVSKRFEPGPIVDHPTEQTLPYESSNYHIEVNTMPPSLFNVDLIFDINTEVTLTKAGTVQIMNEEELGRVEFWYQLGENYLRFYEMNILGDIENQKADFRAGPYMIKYKIRNDKGQQVEKSKKFLIYADKVEQLMLD